MREVVEVWLRLQIARKNVSGTKMSNKFFNQAAKAWIKPLSLSIRAAEKISIELISQAAITSLVVKKEVAKGLKRCIGRMSFVDVLEAITILACFENFLKCAQNVRIYIYF